MGLDDLGFGWLHEGEAAKAVRAFKYGRITALVTPLADRLDVIAPCGEQITWIPGSTQRRRRRGFDPAELLARALARRRSVPARRMLRRRDHSPQTARDREGRLVGPDLEACGPSLSGCVLVIDDVCTTGSTLRVAAAALRQHGANSVVAAVATLSEGGHTPAAGEARHEVATLSEGDMSQRALVADRTSTMARRRG